MRAVKGFAGTRKWERTVVLPLRIEFLFDFGSPNAYLAEQVIPSIERRCGVKFERVPVLLGGIFKATGNKSPFETMRGIKNKPEYAVVELQRFLRRHGITKFKRNPFFSREHLNADARSGGCAV